MGYDRRAINDIANLAFIGGKTNRNISNKLPKLYLEDYIEKRGESLYADHFIPEDKSLWELNRFEDFLDYRRRQMTITLNVFISTLVK